MADQDKLVQVEISLARLESQFHQMVLLMEGNQKVIGQIVESLDTVTEILINKGNK